MDSQGNYIQIKVEDTNSEAMIAKISATNKGYFDDEFADQFVKPSKQRKDVIIHRGYWCRFHIFNRLVNAFMNSGNSKKQIISLGCGYDTMPFHLIKNYNNKDFLYIEIDLPQVIKQKVIKIDKSSKIKGLFDPLDIDWDHYSIKNEKYGLFGLDLTQVDALKEQLQNFKIDFKIPTLIFAECVLTYIDSDSTTNLLQGIRSWFDCLTFINYEMFNGNDMFGKMMVKNFEARGCQLIGIDAFPTMQAHADRLQSLGFKQTEIEDMKTLYQRATDIGERQRIEKIEMLDEWEEWNIMQSHYFVSLSFNFVGDKEDTISIIENMKLKIQ